jgi:hypothetical protein
MQSAILKKAQMKHICKVLSSWTIRKESPLILLALNYFDILAVNQIAHLLKTLKTNKVTI